MTSRRTVIGFLLAVEAAIVVEMGVALRGDQVTPWQVGPVTAAAAAAQSGALVEDGPHRTVRTGPHPSIMVDIGYADLTIVPGDDDRVDASISKDHTFGLFHMNGPIAVTQDGATIRIAKLHNRPSTSDNRMVRLSVPRDARITVINAGDITATGIRGETTLHSIGSGDIAVNDYAAPSLTVASSRGDIALRDIIAGRIEATSARGDVEGSAMQVRDGTIKSGDGHVTLAFANGADALITAETADGDVRVSGAVPLQSDGHDSTAAKTVRVGAGAGRLNVRSSSGSIDLALPSQ